MGQFSALFNTHNQMKYLLLSLLVSVSIVSGNNEPGKAVNEREKRLFSLFSIVTFPNKQCTTASSTSSSIMYGTCYAASECSAKGGTVDGNCAAGFGVCCTFTVSTCGTSVTQNCSYIQNPSYPTSYTTSGSCSYSVTPLSTDICQMRLDFVNFDITETTAGVCTDSFTATGPSGQNPMDLCGTLTKQHLYVEQARSSTATTLKFTIATGGTWKIKVSQIECSSVSKAPSDCDQYLTGISGNVISFNWYGAVLLRNKDFTACIRREKGYCGISYYQATGTTIDSFDLDDAGKALGGESNIAKTTLSYIKIPGVVPPVFSGSVLNSALSAAMTSAGTVYASGNRFIIYLVSHDIAQTSYEGYNLEWAQIPCGANPA